ncbi:fructosamine kinase family protein [Naumannella huperziae]
MQHFTKRGTPRALAYEAAGLAWLGAAGAAPVVPLVEQRGDTLTTARLAPVRPSAAAAEDFGRALAVTHDAGAPAFGCPPDGWAGDGFVGAASLSLAPDERWGRMYAEQRVLPYARQARDAGALAAGELAIIEAVAQRLAAGDLDDEAPPARLHGDLWSGNVISTDAGMIMIDPAAQGGHRLLDLAMLDLFGFSHLDRVFAAYAEASAYLPDNWRQLIGLHQVHHLLVHAVLFGGGYGASAARAARPYR